MQARNQACAPALRNPANCDRCCIFIVVAVVDHFPECDCSLYQLWYVFIYIYFLLDSFPSLFSSSFLPGSSLLLLLLSISCPAAASVEARGASRGARRRRRSLEGGRGGNSPYTGNTLLLLLL